MRYIGFDVGDGESAVAAFEQGSGIEPVMLPVCGVKSFLSAVGTLGGEIVIGERAYTEALADELSVRFKSRFTTDPAHNEDIVRFVRGALRDLHDSGAVHADNRFVIGCPAGWSAAARARYGGLMTRAGIAEPQIISESRAAFLYAKYAKTIALDVDILNQSALVIDIGSSTLDFAYIVDGRETGVGTFGDIALGGGLMDAELLRRAVDKSRDKEALQRVFAESRSWYSYCEIEARRLKEAYYNRLTDDPNASVKKVLRVCYDGVQRLTLTMDAAQASCLTDEPMQSLGGRSFAQAVQEALDQARRLTADNPPKLVLLTGGASRMPFFRTLCREAFGEAIVVCCPEPEFSIAKGLAYAGWIDSNLRAFRKAIQEEVTEERIGQIARDAMPRLIPPVVNALVTLIVDEAAIPLCNQWRKGEIATLEEMNRLMEERMSSVLISLMAQEALAPAINQWLNGLTGQLQSIIDPICDRYEVPRKEMALNLTASGAGKLALNAGELMNLPFFGTVLGIIVSVLTGLLCGGSGVALVAAGPVGFLAGLLLGALVSLFGWGAMTKAMLKADIPLLLRRGDMAKRLKSDGVQLKLRQALSKELGGSDSDFQKQVATGFSRSFSTYLNSIAQSAEIPIE